jgi:arabinogalactan oligomer / maltooligosaccharide transport system substrate-binding protein
MAPPTTNTRTRRRRRRSALLAGAVALAVTAGSAAGSADAATGEPLTLWVYDDGRIGILTELGAEFAEEFGVGVTVEAVDLTDLRNAFLLGVEGEGPDLAIIPHDNLGALVENGAVAPADLAGKEGEYLPGALAGFTYGGELMGVPLAVENIGLIYNTDLVDEVPATWDELREVGAALVEAGDADAAVGFPDLTYNAYPVYTSFGGYIFGRDANGDFTADDIGLDSEGMVAGMTYIGELAADGLIPQNVDWEASHVMFEEGRVPFILTGPWSIPRFRDAGVPYAIGPFPAATTDGAAGHPFLGVQGLIVNAASDQLLLAQAFASEKIATEDSMERIFGAEPRPSAWTTVLEGADDPDTAAFNEAGVDADPMPAIPAMGFVWDAWVDAGTFVVTGDLEPAEALQQAAASVAAQAAEG